MEYTMNNGFTELNAVEMAETDGGIVTGTMVLAGIRLVCAGLASGYLTTKLIKCFK